MTKQPKKRGEDIERIGERKRYRGVFRLYKSYNIFKYAPYGFLTSYSFMKDFKPKVKIDEMGIYIGNGEFVVPNFGGDIFLED